MKNNKILKWVLLITISLFVAACSVNNNLSSGTVKDLADSDHYSDGRFTNIPARVLPGFGKNLGIIKRYIVEKQIDNRPSKALPIKTISRKQLDALSHDDLYVIKLGHSSILLKVYGKYWLIDPVFSERASPFSFVGPKRFQPPPISIDELPIIENVLISHNHYDHLDKASVKKLAAKTQRFLVPLGVDTAMKKWGINKTKIKTFDWWQEYKTARSLIVYTPSQHVSGRSLTDRNFTLWGSWVIKTPQRSIYFSGDSAYFAGFKQIGDKYGPFDLTLIETGAYNKDWPDIHMFPEESVQAHFDLRGKTMVPIHNGTFDLSFHPWYEPLERVTVAAQKRNVNLLTPIVGEVFTTSQKVATNQWWKNSKSKK